MRNTGRFNVAQGAVATAQGIGAALSTALAGIVVVTAGYSAAFLALGAIAAMGVLVFGLAFPARAPNALRSRHLPQQSIAAE
jgi:sugar phosphate permease